MILKTITYFIIEIIKKKDNNRKIKKEKEIEIIQKLYELLQLFLGFYL